MANTVSILSYANTFGEWMVNTNGIASEINNLGKGTYTKDQGTLVLNGSGVSLQVSNTAIFTGNVQLTGQNSNFQTPYLTVNKDADINGNLVVDHTVTTGNLIVTDSLGGGAILRFQQNLIETSVALSIALG
jgi:hypothetical protein